MSKITVALSSVSWVFYLLFYFWLFDAPRMVSNTCFYLCLALSVVNVANSVFVVVKGGVGAGRVTLLFANAVAFLLFLGYLLAYYFLPYNFRFL